jgi:hypothetical protein
LSLKRRLVLSDFAGCSDGNLPCEPARRTNTEIGMWWFQNNTQTLPKTDRNEAGIPSHQRQSQSQLND